ncbi:hypothetical protein M433DRAFT_59894 [Acidomyces richmondensis BFW]|nr:MAG: hypothetical protein FE78DRAFT_135470 [Acidomyces sp. 'richmondensis']KYG49032.1 hypothetical protein M433DRAFT_59894 [Acidomyces richmondensis BFW]
MARTKHSKPGQGQRKIAKMRNASNSKETPEQLYASAIELVEQSQPAEALEQAKKLWNQVQGLPVTEVLPAVNLLGEISVELGDVAKAREYFQQAVELDPNGDLPEVVGGGAEKFLWLAQLCEEGGQVSVDWFEKGVKALQGEISAIEAGTIKGIDEEVLLLMRIEKKRKLANALCAIVEVYMTDLSWEDDAEMRCESLITQAMAVEDEPSPEVLQTLASVRLSQERKEDAQSALSRSLAIWKDLDPEDSAIPDFATRISLSRLLMEADMEEEAMAVLQRLVMDDDQSVEAWYLGGWCQYLIAEKLRPESEACQYDVAMRGSRNWLKMTLKLYTQLNYEDQRLHDHAKELVAELDCKLGPGDGDAEGGEEEQWEEWDGIDEDIDQGEDSDEEMKDS